MPARRPAAPPGAVVSYSGGLSSWAAAWLWMDRWGPDGCRLVFADTFIEDDDNYRFLIEGAAVLFGLPVPDYAAAPLPAVHEDMPARKEALRDLARLAARDIPNLVWLADGRDPWEVMESQRIIGNSRLDPCSLHLKRRLLGRWVEEHADPDITQRVLGINWDEEERFHRVVRRNPGAWWVAPLCEYGVRWGNSTKEELCRSLGVEPPRMYAMGFPHANCGGFCIKAGHGNFKLLYRHFPERYLWHEGRERDLRALVGDHSVLRDRRGGATRPLTMEAFRARVECGGLTEEEEMDLGGCACALPL